MLRSRLPQFRLRTLFLVVTGISFSLALFGWFGAPAIALTVQLTVCGTLLAQTRGAVWRGVLFGFVPIAFGFYVLGVAADAGPQLRCWDWRVLVLAALAGTYAGWLGGGIHAAIIRHRSGPIALFLALAWLPFSCCFGALTDVPGLREPWARQMFPDR